MAVDAGNGSGGAGVQARPVISNEGLKTLIDHVRRLGQKTVVIIVSGGHALVGLDIAVGTHIGGVQGQPADVVVLHIGTVRDQVVGTCLGVVGAAADDENILLGVQGCE